MPPLRHKLFKKNYYNKNTTSIFESLSWNVQVFYCYESVCSVYLYGVYSVRFTWAHVHDRSVIIRFFEISYDKIDYTFKKLSLKEKCLKKNRLKNNTIFSVCFRRLSGRTAPSRPGEYFYSYYYFYTYNTVYTRVFDRRIARCFMPSDLSPRATRINVLYTPNSRKRIHVKILC